MTLSLRMRVALLLLVINGLVAAVTLGFATRQSEKNQAETARLYDRSALILAGSLVDTVAGLIDPDGELNVPTILDWPSWSLFADAILLNGDFRDVGGRLVPNGVAVNPLGRFHRAPGLDHQSVYAAIQRAIARRTPIDGVEGGRVVPILSGQSERSGDSAWGGCWYRLETPPLQTDLVRTYFVPAFLLSTLLLTAGTFFVLRRLVLDPVAKLARGARRVSEGDLSVQLIVPSSRDELSELVRSFNVMTARVADFNARLSEEVRRQTEQARRAETAAMTQRRLAAMGELAAGIAHEINNPLGGLINAVDVLSRENVSPDKSRRYLALLHSGLERIRLTVGQLLRFTPRQARPAPVALGGPIEDSIALVRHRAKRQGVEIRFVRGAPGAAEAGGAPSDLDAERPGDSAAKRPGDPDAELVEGQANELGQALLNLLVNSLDALESKPPGEGRIDVHLWRDGEELRVEVADNGPGVPPEELGRVADLFYTTKDPGKGTGLGLSIVHQIVASHSGSLEFASRPGDGFRVRISLPRKARGGQGAEAVR